MRDFGEIKQDSIYLCSVVYTCLQLLSSHGLSQLVLTHKTALTGNRVGSGRCCVCAGVSTIAKENVLYNLAEEAC